MIQRAGRQNATTARPLGPRAGVLGALMSRAWSLPPRRNRVAVERDLAVPMSDGTALLADHYLPVSVAAAATVLVRCPYGRSGPFALQNAQLLAERGYHVLLQSVRGTFGSGGEFEPMRREITDGQDTVAWLRRQPWFEGRLATFGARYAGSRDNRAVERRPDVLVFSSDPLGEPAEVIGEVAAELSVTRDNPYADLFVRLCDVDPRGRSRNVCDGIVRLSAAEPLTGTVRVSLLGAAHRFGRGHRIRLQVAGGAYPRFARGAGQHGRPAGAAPLQRRLVRDRQTPQGRWRAPGIRGASAAWCRSAGITARSGSTGGCWRSRWRGAARRWPSGWTGTSLTLPGRSGR